MTELHTSSQWTKVPSLVPTVTPNLYEASSHDAVNHSTVARWFKWFQKGRRLTDAPTGRSPAIDNAFIVIMSTILDKDRKMMAREIEEASGIPKTIHRILTEYLMKKKIAVWWVPHMLFPMQKLWCMELCQKYLTCYKGEGIVFLQQIINVWLRTRIEISERGLEGKKFTVITKFQRQASKFFWKFSGNFANVQKLMRMTK